MENAQQRLAHNLNALRRQGQKLNQGDVAEKLTSLGVPTGLNTISRMERGDRVPSALELLAIAAAIGTTPNRLLLTDTVRPTVDIEITPHLAVSEQLAWAWAHGQAPLEGQMGWASNDLIRAFRERSLPSHPNYQLPDVAAHLDAIAELAARVRELAVERGLPVAGLLSMLQAVLFTAPGSTPESGKQS